MFWRKRKDIVLNCYTNRADVYNFFPIVETKKQIPKWFKGLSTPKFETIEDRDTVNLKLCPAFIEYFKRGITLPLWSDLFIRAGKKNTLDYEWHYADKCSGIEVHPSELTNNHFDPLLYQHLKLTSPWLFSCDEDVSFLAVEPGWQFDVLSTARILSGIVNFKYQPNTNINMFLVRENEGTDLLFHAGMPIYNFFPLTDRKITIKNHLVSNEQFRKIYEKGTPFKFTREYEERKKITTAMSCPFKHDITN
jgi:hypothetical protein